ILRQGELPRVHLKPRPDHRPGPVHGFIRFVRLARSRLRPEIAVAKPGRVAPHQTPAMLTNLVCFARAACRTPADDPPGPARPGPWTARQASWCRRSYRNGLPPDRAGQCFAA